MNKLLEEIELLINIPKDAKEECLQISKNIFSMISSCEITHDNKNNFRNVIVPNIFNLSNNHLIRKDLLYLECLAKENHCVLQELVDYEKKYCCNLDFRDPSSLYNFTVFTKDHWFLRVIENVDYLKPDIFSSEIINNILILKCVNFENESNKLSDLESISNNIDLALIRDEFWKNYIVTLKNKLDLVKFFKRVDTKVEEGLIFRKLYKDCLLQCLSEINISDDKHWPEIQKRLTVNDSCEIHHENNYKESEIFKAFAILCTILDLGKTCDLNSINNKLENIKTDILSIENQTLQIQLLEDIYMSLFLKDSTSKSNQEEFRNGEIEVRSMLYLLKCVMDTLKINNVFAKGAELCTKFLNINKYLHDALWRLDLINNIKDSKKIQNNILTYMLSSPNSLIQICLKKEDVVRARQVVEIFNLSKSEIATHVDIFEKIKNLSGEINRTFRLKELKGITPNVKFETNKNSLENVFKNFIDTMPTIANNQQEKYIEDLENEYNFLKHYKLENEQLFNVMDLLCTQSFNVELSIILIKMVEANNTLDPNIKSKYVSFYDNLLQLLRKLVFEENYSVRDILTNPTISLNLKEYEREKKFEKTLANLYDQFQDSINNSEDGVLNNAHPAHKIFFKINTACNNFTNFENPKKVSLLTRLYNYLKAFSKILYIKQNSSDILSKGKNTSYFELLNYNRSELLGKLLFEKGLDPSEFETYFSKIKLDFLYHLTGNCFPTINLHTEENVEPDELFPENYLYKPNANIIQYILKRNWLLALILKNLHDVTDISIDVNETRIQAFINYVKLKRVQNFKAVFENNEILASLQHEVSLKKIKNYMDQKILKHEEFNVSISAQSNDETVETAEEIEEDVFKTTNWKDIYDVLDAIPENMFFKSKELRDLRDTVLEHIVKDRFEIEYYGYVQFVLDANKRIDIIMDNYMYWPSEFCVDIMKIELSKFERNDDIKLTKLREKLDEILFCEELKEILKISTWNECLTEILEHTDTSFKSLITTDKLNLIIKFTQRYKPSEELLLKINETIFLYAFDNKCQLEYIEKLLDMLPKEQATTICKKLIKMVHKFEHLQFLIEYLEKNNVENDLSLKISLKMFSLFFEEELEQILPLIGKPLEIIEFLIMNTKFDKLAKLMETLKSNIDNSDFEDPINVEKIDELLRKYAEKSLDFRVITQPNPRLLRTPEHKLLQSIDSLTFGDKNHFVMPYEVPLKDEWVQNHEVLDCMCCSQVTFSMFNRRHHCRRCGRVVCYNCSQKRMQVDTYGDILVRVCIDCYKQTMGESLSSEKSEISTRTNIYDLWLLTDDEDNNKILREEFSYEHAPSVSLCLSIMKFHSNSIQYPEFLLNQCNFMLKLLHPTQEPLQEIDYLLVIKMLKSLAVAAKMKSQECSLQYGISLAERLLSQADLLSLFAERGCLNLLPISNNNQTPYIDASVLRRLRDKLLEKEQWNLALEVSTKAGLESSGVFAAWGKSCLKAGCLTLAREKFQRCLDRNFYYEVTSESLPDIEISNDTASSTNRIRYSSRSSTLSNVSENRPLKNPPLLNEIIHILELKTAVIDKIIVDEISFQGITESTISLDKSTLMTTQQDKAVSILNKLRNLNAITQGNYFFPTDKKVQTSYASNRPIIDTVFYNECIYYLNRYGSYQSLLEFYVKHGELDQALQYILDNKMSTELFVEIYMRCLKDGMINILQENMYKIDSTLDLWKDYLMQICRYLEKQNLLNSLYQLQLFMGDYIRAAMTCIRFYEESIYNFSDLSRKVNFLHKAEEHLKQLYEQDQWVEVASVRKISTDSQESYEEKSIGNSLVMKINNKNIGAYINTIWRQNEVASFLADCEAAGLKPMETLAHILPEEDSGAEKKRVPTLFGGSLDKIRLAVLIIVTAAEVDKGFKIALRIINDFKLRSHTIYCQASKQFARNQKFDEIAELVNCIKNEHGSDKAIMEMCDEMLTLAVATLTKENIATETKVENLIKLISDKATKISAYIEAKQLKTAYFYAVRFKRMGDIRRILREAEMNNQPNIKALCQKVLQSQAQSSSKDINF